MVERTIMAKRSAKYYAENPKANAKKKAYAKQYDKKPENVAKRVELNRLRRKAKAAGKSVKGKDISHKSGGTTLENSSTNRGRKGEGGRTKGRSHNYPSGVKRNNNKKSK